jgi:hypothetical protein
MGLWDNKNDEPWDKDLPPDLVVAIKPLRKSFDHSHFAMGWPTRHLCYAQLHKELGNGHEDQEHLDTFQKLKLHVPPDAMVRFRGLVQRDTLPSIFKAYFDFYVDGMANQARLIFGHLLEVGLANEGRLSTGGVQWAEAQSQHLIRSHRHNVQLWILDVCDKNFLSFKIDSARSKSDRWESWQAPSFLVMKPAKHGFYEPEKVWERRDPETSARWLEAFADDYVIRLEMIIEKLAGNALLERAKRPNGAAERLEQPKTVPQGADAESDFSWKELETRFREIQARATPSQEVRAEWTRTEWDSGSINEGWELRGTASLRSEYAELASIAARKLGYAPADNAYKSWLGQVWEWMQQVGLDKATELVWCPLGSGTERGSSYTTKHFFSQSIAELSAKYCLNLIARGIRESVEVQSHAISHSEPAQTGTVAERTTRSSSLNYSSPTKRAILVALTRDPASTDLQVWRSIDADGSADLPASWVTRVNDRSFELAHKNKEVRPKMEKMISKVRADMRSKQLM